MIKVIKAEFMKNMKRKDILAMLLINILLPFLVTYLAKSGTAVKSSLKTPLENTFVISFSRVQCYIHCSVLFVQQILYQKKLKMEVLD